MKILLINHSLKAGGAERQFVELLKGLSRLPNLEVKVFLFSAVIEYDEVKSFNIKIYTCPKKNGLDLRPLKVLNEILTAFQPDVVHSWHWVANFYLLPLSLKHKFNFIDGSLRDANTPGTAHALLYFFSKKMAKKIVANSQAGLKAYGVKQKGQVIYNGVDIDRFSEQSKAMPQEWDIVVNRKNITSVGMVGRFHKHKDYQTYLQVADELSRTNSQLYFFAIGEGPQLSFFQEKYNNNKQIIFTGRISQVELLINRLDVGVLLSNPMHHAEGISNALLEFMCQAKPIIATSGGGTSELVQHRINGLLLDPLNVKQFRYALLELLKDPEKRMTYGQRGKEIVLSKFSFERMINQYIQLYEEVASIDVKIVSQTF